MKVIPKPFTKSFFLRPTLEVARGLLGSLLVRELPQGRLVGRVVEVEAYLRNDSACHCVRTLKDGTCIPRPSARNKSMFGPPGHAYVYFTYGVHWALNVATQKEGIGEGVLIRALEPLEGLEIMAALRGVELNEDRIKTKGPKERLVQYRRLTSGPGKLAKALAIDRTLDGHDLGQGPLRLLQGSRVDDDLIGVSRRIGIVKAVDHPYRFFEKGNPFVSKRQ